MMEMYSDFKMSKGLLENGCFQSPFVLENKYTFAKWATL